MLSCMKRRVSCGTDAATSSMDVLANILKIITVPVLAAAVWKIMVQVSKISQLLEVPGSYFCEAIYIGMYVCSLVYWCSKCCVFIDL